MRRLQWLASVSFLLAAGAANATIIATGGGPSITVTGALQAFAADPFGTGTPIDRDETYDETKVDPNGNGSIPTSGVDSVAQSFAEFDGEATILGSSASASYNYFFGHDGGGNLSIGAMTLTALANMSINEDYFDGASDFAAAQGIARAINFMDLAITDVDYLFAFDGYVQDDIAQISAGGGVFFYMADVTSGFDILGIFTDATPNDFSETTFTDQFLLQAGHQYRFGIGAATDFLCTETTGAALCPTVIPGTSDPAVPQPVGFYAQSGAASVNFELTAVPEPGTALLLGAGVALLAGRRRS